MPSTVPPKPKRGKAGVVLDEGVPERVTRGRGKSAAEGETARGKAAGAVAKKLDALANPPKGRKKPPADEVGAPGAVVGKKSDVPPDPKARKKPAADGVVLGGKASWRWLGRSRICLPIQRVRRSPLWMGLSHVEG